MNREETIKWLKSLKAEIGKSEHRTLWHYAEAIDMAIEALEQEPVVRCWDCIHAERMNKPWADGRQIVFCWKHGKERFTAGDGYCDRGERVKE